mmetsp:Transcript_84420/g.133339  ORF Transcript_84420/g.133339 Transcript_84420/m.133339 type:complete len:223 (-) Transcript_84420:52-720(-)
MHLQNLHHRRHSGIVHRRDRHLSSLQIILHHCSGQTFHPLCFQTCRHLCSHRISHRLQALQTCHHQYSRRTNLHQYSAGQTSLHLRRTFHLSFVDQTFHHHRRTCHQYSAVARTCHRRYSVQINRRQLAVDRSHRILHLCFEHQTYHHLCSQHRISHRLLLLQTCHHQCSRRRDLHQNSAGRRRRHLLQTVHLLVAGQTYLRQLVDHQTNLLLLAVQTWLPK